MLDGDETLKPSVPELLAASEAILLTSLQEGFGLPYLEAIAAGRPLMARHLSNIAPDLKTFGFRLPKVTRTCGWTSCWTGTANSDAGAPVCGVEAADSAHGLRLPGRPAMLAAGHRPLPVAFSRLTLTAQLEVLARPVEHSWERCAQINPFLKTWRPEPPREQSRSFVAAVGGAVAGRKCLRPEVPRTRVVALGRAAPPRNQRRRSGGVSGQKLRAENLYPLLWTRTPDIRAVIFDVYDTLVDVGPLRRTPRRAGTECGATFFDTRPRLTRIEFSIACSQVIAQPSRSGARPRHRMARSSLAIGGGRSDSGVCAAP